MANGIASAQDIRNLFVNVHAAMTVLGRRNPDNIEEVICHTIDGVGDSEEIPFSENQTTLGELNPDQERSFIGAEGNKFVIQHKLLGPSSGFHVNWDVLQNDARQFRLLQTRTEQMTIQSTLIWRTRLAAMMHAPTVSYDGVAFYSASHLVNPQKPALGVQGNILPGTVLDKAGIISAIQKLIDMKGHNGDLLSTPTDLAIVVPGFDMEVRAKEVINASTTPVAVGANAAVAVANQIMGVARVLRFPELQALSTKRWYVLDLSDALDRAFYLSKVRPATFGFDGLSPNDESRKRRHRVEYWWDAFGGVAPARHQKIVRGEEP